MNIIYNIYVYSIVCVYNIHILYVYIRYTYIYKYIHIPHYLLCILYTYITYTYVLYMNKKVYIYYIPV